MKNINHIKYLEKSSLLSGLLIFVHFLLITFMIIFFFPYSSTLTIVFSILFVISILINLSCVIAIIVFISLVKINGEKEPELIIFSILNFFLFIISPIVFYVLVNKYINVYNKEIINVSKEEIDLETDKEEINSLLNKKDINTIIDDVKN